MDHDAAARRSHVGYYLHRRRAPAAQDIASNTTLLSEASRRSWRCASLRVLSGRHRSADLRHGGDSEFGSGSPDAHPARAAPPAVAGHPDRRRFHESPGNLSRFSATTPETGFFGGCTSGLRDDGCRSQPAAQRGDSSGSDSRSRDSLSREPRPEPLFRSSHGCARFRPSGGRAGSTGRGLPEINQRP